MSLTEVERIYHEWNMLRNNRLQQVSSGELLTATLISLGVGEMFWGETSLGRGSLLTVMVQR